MLYSRKRSVELVLEHEKQNGFKYDLVLLTRFDIALFKKFEFEKYDSEEVVVKEIEKNNKSYNPIKDKESFLVRIFRGRVDRI